MTTQDLINTLKQGKPMTAPLMREIVRELEDLKKLKDAAMFVLEECDWENDKRIAEALRKALEVFNA